MTQADERILEFLSEEGNYPPKAMATQLAQQAVDMEYHPNYVAERCRILRDYGLLLNIGSGTYSITDLGERFLSGNLDAGTLEPDG